MFESRLAFLSIFFFHPSLLFLPRPPFPPPPRFGCAVEHEAIHFPANDLWKRLCRGSIRWPELSSFNEGPPFFCISSSVILNWAENAVSLVFWRTSFHQPVFCFFEFFFFLSDVVYFLSRALIPLCLNGGINESACAKRVAVSKWGWE